MGRWTRRILVVAGVLVLSAALVWWTSPWTAERLDAVYPEIPFRVETSDSLVALTLDDGPSEATARLLDLLERSWCCTIATTAAIAPPRCSSGCCPSSGREATGS